MSEIFVPTLHTFAMNNVFTGSIGNLRYKITPSVSMHGKEVDFGNSSMSVQIWYGLFCFEKSEVVDSETFPLTEEGRQAMIAWLTGKK